MFSKRKLIALSIIIVSLVVSAVILSSEKSNAEDTSTTQVNSNGELLGFESLVAQVIENKRENSGLSTTTDNFTDSLINSFAANAAGKENLSLTEEEAEQILSGNIPKSFNENKFSIKDIQVSNNDSESSKAKYIEEVDRLLRQTFSDFGDSTSLTILQQFLDEGNPELLNYFIDTIPVFIDEILNIKVPPSFTDYHVEMLNIWQKKLNQYSAIKNYEDDPLKAYAAMKELQNTIQDDMDLQVELINIYNNLNN